MHDVHIVITHQDDPVCRQNLCLSPIFLAITTGPRAAPGVLLPTVDAAATGPDLAGPSASGSGLYLNAWIPLTISELDLTILLIST